MPNLVNLEIINDNLWMYAQCAPIPANSAYD